MSDDFDQIIRSMIAEPIYQDPIALLYHTRVWIKDTEKYLTAIKAMEDPELDQLISSIELVLTTFRPIADL